MFHCPSNGHIPPLWTEKYSKAMESRGIRRQGVLSKSKQAYPHFASDVGAVIKFKNSAVAQFVAIVVIISTFLQGSEMDASVVFYKTVDL